MKVLHLGKYYPPYFGGIEKVNFDIVEGLNESDIQTDVLCFNDNNNNDVNENGYTIWRASRFAEKYSTPLSFSVFPLLHRIAKDYDILHIHLPNPVMCLAVLFCVTRRNKIVLHWHSDVVKQKLTYIIFKPIEQSILKRAARIIVTSNDYLSGSVPLKRYKDKCVCVPIGIDSDEIKINQELIKEIRLQYATKKIIFSLGRFVYYKGFEFLLQAMKELSDDVVLLLGGGGPLESALKQYSVENGLCNRVVFLGRIPNEHLGAYYSASHCFVLPSIERSEAFGVVLIEALSFSKPLITTAIPNSGVNYVNANGVTGIVVNVRDSHDLAQAIQGLFSNSEKYGEYCRNARSRYEELFTKQRMASAIKDIYFQLERKDN